MPSAARSRAVVGPLPGPPSHPPTRRKRAPADKPAVHADSPSTKPSTPTSATRKANARGRTDFLLVDKRLSRAAASRAACLDLSRSLTPAANEPGEVFRMLPPAILLQPSLAAGLKQLWLTNNALTVLPAEIGALKRLQVLGLGGNALSTLPTELHSLSNLERLCLERNSFRALPASLQLPTGLRDLRLDHNALTAFPVPVTRLRLLNRLGLSHNKLRGQLPAQIGRLRCLVELDLDNNALGPSLAPEMSLLRRLERLGLEGNGLSASAVDAVLQALPSLAYVRVSGNRGDWDGTVGGERSTDLPTAAPGDGGPQADGTDGSGHLTAPRRRDGYFQTTCGYREVTSGSPAAADDGQARPPPLPLPGLVPCCALNLGNAELYRGASARSL